MNSVNRSVFHSLYAKLTFSLAVLFAIIGLAVIGIIGLSTDLYQQEVTQRLNRDLAQQIVAEQLLLHGGRIDQRGLESVFHMMMVVNPGLELYLLNPSGRILAYSAPPGVVRADHVDMEPVRRFLDGGADLPLMGENPRDPDRKAVFSAARIMNHDRLEGYLYVILAAARHDGVTSLLRSSYILRASVWAVVTALIFILLAGLFVFALLTRRLRRLSMEVQSFRDSGFTEPPAVHATAGGDEIDELAARFQEMAGRLREQMERLRDTDRQRRDMVANVSHDLRTPLASLKGYLETLQMKAETLSGEEKNRYVEIATRHAERLGRLVEELFELAKLDANEVRLNCEPFSPAELIQDVIQKFQLRAREKDITLDYRLQGTVPFVSADIGLIERVLDNLIENALRYTPAHGHITISLLPEQDKVVVEITDNGCGIEEHELSHVFERFYRPRQNDDRAGAGLGLAIAKRIVELHGGVIRARSLRNRGTTFWFQLPAAQLAR
jgi:two-component system OmpR family sensor kinase